MTSLERKVNRAVLRQLNKNAHDAFHKWVKNHGNDEADFQDFMMKADAWKQELSKE